MNSRSGVASTDADLGTSLALVGDVMTKREGDDRTWGETVCEELGDDELIALVLAGRGRRVIPISRIRELLARRGGLPQLVRASPSSAVLSGELGKNGGARVAAALQIARRTSEMGLPRVSIRNPSEVVREVSDLAEARRETMIGLYLDAQTRLIARETVAVGSLNVARAAPRDVLEPAVRLLAAGFVLAHNHPSGLSEPSDEDVSFTRAIGRAARLIGVSLFDHVVVARASYVSMRERGVKWED